MEKYIVQFFELYVLISSRVNKNTWLYLIGRHCAASAKISISGTYMIANNILIYIQYNRKIYIEYLNSSCHWQSINLMYLH